MDPHLARHNSARLYRPPRRASPEGIRVLPAGPPVKNKSGAAWNSVVATVPRSRKPVVSRARDSPHVLPIMARGATPAADPTAFQFNNRLHFVIGVVEVRSLRTITCVVPCCPRNLSSSKPTEFTRDSKSVAHELLFCSCSLVSQQNSEPLSQQPDHTNILLERRAPTGVAVRFAILTFSGAAVVPI